MTTLTQLASHSESHVRWSHEHSHSNHTKLPFGPMSGVKVWIDQDLCTGDGICEEIAPAIFFGAEDGLYYVREANTEVPAEPTHSFHEPVDVPDNLLEATIDAAEECPGECIFLDVE